MYDIKPEFLSKSIEAIKGSLTKIGAKKFPDDASKSSAFINDTLKRISTSTDIKASAKQADLVIEAIVENVEVKQKLFKVRKKTCR